MLPKRILLAEDDADDQKIFMDFLHARTDVEIMPVADNGVDLMEFLENKVLDNSLPHIIILDQNMPKRNGIQTLQLLKSKDRYAHIPVMIYSTYTDNDLIQISTESGATAVLTKPFTKAGYNEMLDELLKIIP